MRGKKHRWRDQWRNLWYEILSYYDHDRHIVAQLQDGIVKHAGAVMFIKNGRPQRVDRELKLSEGITVQPDGDVTLKDGTKLTLQDGQMVTLDSKVTTIPPGAMDKLGTGESSASGLTTPGASSGSSLGPGSNSTLAPGSSSGSTSTGTTGGGPWRFRRPVIRLRGRIQTRSTQEALCPQRLFLFPETSSALRLHVPKAVEDDRPPAPKRAQSSVGKS